MGPAPTPVPEGGSGADLDPARRRVLRALADRGTGGTGSTVGEVAAIVGGHPNTARYHLRALAEAGLARAWSDAGPNPGRPPTRYAVSPAGRRALGPGPGDPSVEEYLELVGAFADRLAAHGVDASGESRSVGRAWGSVLAARDLWDPPATTGEPRYRVMALLDRLGFSPRPSPVSSQGSPEDPREMELRTCPLLDAARRHPEVVCQVHAGLVSGADAAYGGTGEGVRLVPFARPGCCLLMLPRAR